MRNLNRAANVVVGILVDEHSVHVLEGDTELDGETPDDVGIEIWGELSIVEGFNCMIFFHTFNDGFKILAQEDGNTSKFGD